VEDRSGAYPAKFILRISGSQNSAISSLAGRGAGGNHALGIPGQDILRTLIVKEAVETRELER
jgi:hypothetical protein